MLTKGKSLASGLLLLLLTGASTWILLQDSESVDVETAESAHEPNRQLQGNSMQYRAAKEQLPTNFAKFESSAEPLDVQAFREARGYYASGGNDVGAKHPYEYFDDTTLKELADQQDGLAQLVLADKISNRDFKSAMSMYLEAAVNGKTAALINMASGQLVVRCGQAGWGFDLTHENGEISEKYAEILQYYAAAELLGDFAGTYLLEAHISSGKLSDAPDNIAKLCAYGAETARNIRKVRYSRWGKRSFDEIQIKSVQKPRPICGDNQYAEHFDKTQVRDD